MLFLVSAADAQELRCRVTVNTPQLAIVDPKVFRTLEDQIFEFMNTRSWSGDVFKQEERIEVDLNITITEEISNDRFKARLSVQSSRPVFNSDYSTVLLNWVDNDFEFSYAEFQALEFNENVNLGNLTSVLAFYAYVVLGYDYDSFASNAGTPFWLKAQKIVNNMQNAPEKGWKPYDGIRNRYWLVENMLNPKFAPFRESFYRYHRLALDRFHEDQLGPVAIVSQCLADLNRVHSSSPNSMAMQLFFNAKSTEVIGIYTDAPPQEKTKAIGVLNRVDPQNANKYRKIMSGGR